MINEKTILSFADEKLTLMQWLKKVEASLDGASLKSIEPVQVKDGYFNLIFHFEDGTTIETPTAIELKGFKGDKGDKGDRGEKGDPFNIVVIPSGSDILTFDFSPYASGQLFIGTKLTNMPSEIDNEHSQVVVQLLRNNSTLYCLKLWNTGLYQGNQGEYTIYHYATSYTGWEKVTTLKDLPKGIKLNNNNNFIMSKEDEPFNLMENSNLIVNEVYFNGNELDDTTKGVVAKYNAPSQNCFVRFITQPCRTRTQLTYDTTLILSKYPDIGIYNPVILQLGPYGSGIYPDNSGITNGTFIFKMLPFNSLDFQYIDMQFGNYQDKQQPFFETLLTDKLPQNITIEINELNKNIGTHRIRFVVKNTITKPILFLIEVINGIAKIAVCEEN